MMKGWEVHDMWHKDTNQTVQVVEAYLCSDHVLVKPVDGGPRKVVPIKSLRSDRATDSTQQDKGGEYGNG